jgi:hypothetical protein
VPVNREPDANDRALTGDEVGGAAGGGAEFEVDDALRRRCGLDPDPHVEDARGADVLV